MKNVIKGIRSPLHYWRNRNTAEIDFLIKHEDGAIKVTENKKIKKFEYIYESTSTGIYIP